MIWSGVLDDRFFCSLTMLSEFTGELLITEKGVVIHKEIINLSYQPIFGLDISDLLMIEDKCVDIVDQL